MGERRRHRLWVARWPAPDATRVWLLDANIVPLLAVLNALPGVRTVGSCGGHAQPSATQMPEGSWYVKFDLTWDATGQRTLAALAWWVNNRSAKRGYTLLLFPYAVRPMVASPLDGLAWVLEGHGVGPRRTARALRRWLDARARNGTSV